LVRKQLKGSFSRSSVNAQSGVATPAGGGYVGGLVIMALAFLTPAFVFIPSATLVLTFFFSTLNSHVPPNDLEFLEFTKSIIRVTDPLGRSL